MTKEEAHEAIYASFGEQGIPRSDVKIIDLHGHELNKPFALGSHCPNGCGFWENKNGGKAVIVYD